MTGRRGAERSTAARRARGPGSRAARARGGAGETAGGRPLRPRRRERRGSARARRRGGRGGRARRSTHRRLARTRSTSAGSSVAQRAAGELDLATDRAPGGERAVARHRARAARRRARPAGDLRASRRRRAARERSASICAVIARTLVLAGAGHIGEAADRAPEHEAARAEAVLLVELERDGLEGRRRARGGAGRDEHARRARPQRREVRLGVRSCPRGR